MMFMIFHPTGRRRLWMIAFFGIGIVVGLLLLRLGA